MTEELAFALLLPGGRTVRGCLVHAQLGRIQVAFRGADVSDLRLKGTHNLVLQLGAGRGVPLRAVVRSQQLVESFSLAEFEFLEGYRPEHCLAPGDWGRLTRRIDPRLRLGRDELVPIDLSAGVLRLTGRLLDLSLGGCGVLLASDSLPAGWLPTRDREALPLRASLVLPGRAAGVELDARAVYRTGWDGGERIGLQFAQTRAGGPELERFLLQRRLDAATRVPGDSREA